MASRRLPRPISRGSGAVSRRITVPESSGPRCASVLVALSSSPDGRDAFRATIPKIPHMNTDQSSGSAEGDQQLRLCGGRPCPPAVLLMWQAAHEKLIDDITARDPPEIFQLPKPPCSLCRRQ